MAKEILEDVRNKYVSFYFFRFEPVFKERRSPEKETKVVNELLLSMGFDEGSGRRIIADLQNNLLGDSADVDLSDAKQGNETLSPDSPKFQGNLQFSQTQNMYQSSEISQYFEKFGNEKFQLIDFRTSLRVPVALHLAAYFKTERTPEQTVLIGYVSRVFGKLLEVASSEVLDFLGNHPEVMQGIIKNVGDHSVVQLLVTLLSDNFVVRERKTETTTEELLKSRSLEMSYGKGFDSRSKNKIFRDCSETIFDCQKQEIAEVLEKGGMLLLKDIVKQEVEEYKGRLERGKALLVETFRELLKNARMEPTKTGNIVRVILEVLCKCLDLICEEVGIKGANTYMNRMNR